MHIFETEVMFQRSRDMKIIWDVLLLKNAGQSSFGCLKFETIEISNAIYIISCNTHCYHGNSQNLWQVNFDNWMTQKQCLGLETVENHLVQPTWKRTDQLFFKDFTWNRKQFQKHNLSCKLAFETFINGRSAVRYVAMSQNTQTCAANKQNSDNLSILRFLWSHFRNVTCKCVGNSQWNFHHRKSIIQAVFDNHAHNHPISQYNQEPDNDTDCSKYSSSCHATFFTLIQSHVLAKCRSLVGAEGRQSAKFRLS